MRLGFAVLLGALSCSAVQAQQLPVKPIPIHVVVVTTFEIGPDTAPKSEGEFRRWVEGVPLPETIPFPQGFHHLRYNAQKQVLGIETGEGPAHAASSIMGLGMDPRFDLSHAYWIVAAIAGVDPNRASVGSAAWARYVVDGDLAYEIDAREIPHDWTTGYVPLNRATPHEKPVPPVHSLSGDQVYRLDPATVDWAYRLTRDVTLPDDANLQKVRAPYTSYPAALKPPFVLEGADLAAGTFWTGNLLNRWAENWVDYWTHGAGKFTMTAEEDAGVLEALTGLSHVGKADLHRVLILRTASDYSVPPPGISAADFLKSEATAAGLSGFAESLDAAYRVGSVVVNEIAGNWDRYRGGIPGARP